MEHKAVEVMYSLLIFSKHSSYSGENGSPVQGPPESARIRGFTARMYAIVRKVARKRMKR